MEGIAPCDVKSIRDVCSLEKSTHYSLDFWIIVNHDGGVSIVKQRSGELKTGEITVPRKTFARMVEFYLKRQERRME